LKRFAKGSLWGTALLAAAVAAMAYLPLSASPLSYTATEPRTYTEAVSEVDAENRRSAATIQPECRGTLLLNGRRTDRVFLLLHGLSNCPAQFRQFGELLFRRRMGSIASF
jgi:hypothetical protein